MSCFSESDIIPYALDLIRSNPGIRTSELIDKLRAIMEPSGEDLVILKNRSDDKFSQKVRNIKSHKSIEYEAYTVGEHDCQWYIR